MMPAAQQHQIVEPGFATFGPVHNMVAFNVEILRTAGKLAMAVAAE